MKVFIAVAIEVDFTTRSSEITNDRLTHLTGLSRQCSCQLWRLWRTEAF